MRFGLRLLLCASFLLFFPLYLLEAHLQDLYDQYSAGAYVTDWWNYKQPTSQNAGSQKTPGDKVIVMAKMEQEQTSWVEDELPEYVITLPESCLRYVHLTHNFVETVGNVRFT